MRRRHRRIQYYNAEPTRERLRDKRWFPFAVIALAALVVALIVGAILGGVAKKADRDGIVYRDLTEFGGAEKPVETYADLYRVQSLFVDHEGLDNKACRKAAQELTGGNAAAFWVYDGQGGVFFSSSLADKTDGLTERAHLTAEELEGAADADGRYAVGYFVTGAFADEDLSLRLLAAAREMALIAELSDAGFREIVIVGLPTGPAFADEVRDYVRRAYGLCGRTYLSVAVPHDSADAARLVGVTEGFADSYTLDLRSLSDDALTRAITENAYYLTYYNMRMALSDADPDTAHAVAESFGIESYHLMPETTP